MTGRWAWLWLALVPLMGCTSQDDIRARYQLERMLWQAQYHQRRMNISFLGASKRDIQNALNAYQSVVTADPLVHGIPPGWDTQAVSDIRELLLSARIALANLYFATQQYTDARSLYASTLHLGSINFKDLLEVRLGAARATYMGGNQTDVIRQCERIFREVEASPEFWAGEARLDDTFLNIPVTLVRMHAEAGDTAAADSAHTDALGFYRRVSATWPESPVDWQSRLAVAQLHMLADDWAAAASDLETILTAPHDNPRDLGSIELVLGEIEAFRLSRPGQAERRFRGLQERFPETPLGYAAAYDLAALRLAQGDAREAIRDFREIERAPRAPDAVASRAMLAHARVLESQGDWDSAYALLRRLEQLHPFTAAAVEAPLMVTRHYVKTGNRQMVRVATDHAHDYYTSLLDRGSAFTGNRLMVQSALADNYVAAGEAREAARLLESGSVSWDDHSTAAAMLKAAGLYLDALDDTTLAREALEKVIARYPDSRYSRVASARLAAIDAR